MGRSEVEYGEKDGPFTFADVDAATRNSFLEIDYPSGKGDSTKPLKAISPNSYERCVHHLFAAQAELAPDAIATVFGSTFLTYKELNTRADQLAQLLLSKGVGTDIPVATCMKRSLALPVALLGVLKAGGACLPLDPTYPADRLSYMMRDSQAPLMITNTQFPIGTFDSPFEILQLREDFTILNSFSGINHDPHSAPNDLGYVIYTSGSTGEPRGVLLEHRGLVNHHLAAVELYGLRSADRVLQFSALGFDIAVEEMFPTWLAGATVVFRTENTPLAASEFMQWIAHEKITVLDLPTAYWHEVVRELVESNEVLPSTLRLVIVGGEKASSSAYADWLKIGGAKVRWVNTYGPTETSVIATAYEPEPSMPIPESMPIGRPIRNYSLRIVDSNLETVPRGTPGELLIGGPGVARGYLNRTEQTSKKFIPCSNLHGGSERFYRTGDVVREREDGNLEFIGRTDFQVKIRGFRVELGEIESALERHPSVKAVAVAAHETQFGKNLCAYIVPSGSAPAAMELRRFLEKILPEYMVPGSYTFLSTLPLTPNGKVDRRALPTPLSVVGGDREIASPRDDFEARMLKIWQQVLGQKQISIHDNFFDLGGHSLLAIRLTHRIDKVFGKKILITKLIDAPTIAALTTIIRDGAPEDVYPSIIPLQPVGSKAPFFFVHGLFGSVLRFRDLAQYMAPDQPFYGIQAQGLDGVLPPLDQVEAMVNLYYEQLRRFYPHGPYYLGGYSFGGLVALELARRLTFAGERVGLLALVDTYFGSGDSAGLLRRFSSLPLSGKLAYVVKRAARFRKGLRMTARVLSLPPAVQQVRKCAAVAEREYKPTFYPGKITLFRATEKGLRGLDDPNGNWQKIAGGGLEVHEIDGDHGSILNEPRVGVLASQIRLCLEQCQQ